MPQIKIEKKPSQTRLQEMGVDSWEIWDCPVSEFRLDFDETEKAYLLEGEIIVTPDGEEPVHVVAGDYVEFPEGLNSFWQVVKPLRKHYSYD
ncbi:cupin domain-containing protein [Methylophaga sp.]|uniref:cupin domain-containing protein n=1 Tax=Methylophaga sp. TaxID=2024840 RepID=UPI003F69671F